jgi:hypothetical protein
MGSARQHLWRILRFGGSALALTLGAIGPPARATCPAPIGAAAGIPYFVDFDSFPEDPNNPNPGDILTTEYAASRVCFTSSPDSMTEVIDPVVATQSEPQAVQNSYVPGGGDVIGSRDTPLRIHFLVPMREVSMKIGWGMLISPPAECPFAPKDPITLTAYGRTVAGTTDEVASTALAFPLPVEILNPIAVGVADPNAENITYVDLDFRCFHPEVLDNLSLVTSGVPPVLDTTDPNVVIDAPSPGQVFNAPLVSAVTGRIFEADSAPAIEVNGVAGTVSPAPGLGNYTFRVEDVPLPLENANILTATATDGSGNSGADSVVVQRVTPAIFEMHSLQISQTGIIDPQPGVLATAEPPPFIQPSIVIGKTTMLRFRLEVFSSSMAVSFIDDALLDVIRSDGTVAGVVPTSAYFTPTTAAVDCADLACGVHFFVPGTFLWDSADTTDFRFRIRYFVGGAQVGEVFLGPYDFHQTIPYEHLVSPVEIPWSLFDEMIIIQSLDMMSRTYPVRDGAGFFSTTASPPGLRGVEWVVPTPVDLADDPGIWVDDWVNYDVDLQQVEGDPNAPEVCIDVQLRPMPGLTLGRTKSYPEDTNGDGIFDPTERGRFCPKVEGRPAVTRYGNLMRFLRSHVRSVRDRYNFWFDPAFSSWSTLLSSAISTPGVYTSASLNQNWNGGCGGHAKTDWAWNVGGIVLNCPKVVVHEYSHSEGLWCHSRDQAQLNDILVEELPDCGPLEGDEGPGCDSQIPTANGAAYNLLSRIATDLRSSYMTTRISGDTFSNNYLRNEEYTYLAQEHAVGWYSGPHTRTLCGEDVEIKGESTAAQGDRGDDHSASTAANPWNVLGSVRGDTGDVRILWAGPVDANTPLTPEGSSVYTLQIKDSGGFVLLSYTLDVISDRPGHADDPFEPGTSPEIDLFAAVVDLPAGADLAEITDGIGTLWSVQRGASPPVVSLLLPSGGESFLRGDDVDLEWTASDADANTVLYTDVHFSPDGGARFLPLGGSSDGSERTWRPYLAPGTNNGIVRVTVSDGFDVATSENDSPFTLEDASPVVVMLDPPDGTALLEHEELALRVFAFDPEGGMLDGISVSWSSDLDGSLGNGATLVKRGLTPGLHKISVVVVDKTSHVESRIASLEILSDRDRDGLSDDYENDNDLDPDDPSDAALDVDGDGLNYLDEAFLGTDPSWPDTDGDGMEDGEEARRGGNSFNGDTDGDGVPDGADNCLLTFNDGQGDADGDGAGDACDNCQIRYNPTQADLDRDGTGDHCDGDDDGDGAFDAADCAPADPFAFAVPGEPLSLWVEHGPGPAEITLGWTPSGSGTGAFFDVTVGLLDDLPAQGFGASVCAASRHPGNGLVVPLSALGGDATYILVREQNACGAGGWGAQSNGSPRPVAACP